VRLQPKNVAEVEELLDSDAYEALVGELGE